MTADVKLLPCPFCGKDEHLQVEHLEGTILHPAYRVFCDNCGVSTGYTDKDCRADWNTRANMEPLIAENERLRAEVAEWKAAYQQAADASLAHAERAERLAEALQRRLAEWEAWGSNPDHPISDCPQDARADEIFQRCAAEVRAALDQEGGNG